MAQQNQNRPNQGNQRTQLRQQLLQRHENKVAHREERLQKAQERFTAAPTGQQARHQAHAAASAEYNPTLRGIRGELAGSRAAQAQSTSWYNQLGSEQAAAAQGEVAGANEFSSNLTQQLAQANNTNAAYLAQQQAAQAQNAATTGIPMPASSGQPAAAGAAVGAADAVALNAPVQAAARNQAALTERLGIASKERGHEVAGEDITARKAMRQDLQAAQKGKGQAYVGKLAEERESARKQVLEAKALEVEGEGERQAAALEQQKLAQERQAEAKAERLKRQENATAQGNEATKLANEGQETANNTKEANAAAAKARYERNHGGKTQKEVAEGNAERKGNPAEKREKREEAKAALTSAHSTYALFKGTKEFQMHTPEEQRAILEEALAKRGVEATVAKWAVNKLWQGVNTTEAVTRASSGF